MPQRVVNWVRPRRWSILVEAVLAVVLALVSWPTLASNSESAEIELVTDYLEAVREGDLDEARSYMADQEGEIDETWLTEEALSSDWEIESVESRSASTTRVHVTISSGGETSESTFSLEGSKDELLISNPYMYLSLPDGPFRSLKLNDRWSSASEETQDDDGQRLVALFPGSYHVYEGLEGFSGENETSFLALPQSQPVLLTSLVGDEIAGNTEIEERFNQDLAAWIDLCAESTEAAPEGCPFSAGRYYGTGVDDGRDEFDEVEDLTWAVDVYPHMRFGSDLLLETVSPGWMTLSGNGTLYFEETTAPLQGRCSIEVSSYAVALLDDGRFEFTPTEKLDTTCYRGLT